MTPQEERRKRLEQALVAFDAGDSLERVISLLEREIDEAVGQEREAARFVSDENIREQCPNNPAWRLESHRHLCETCHARALTVAQREAARLMQALESAWQDIKVCNWKCVGCGLDPEMKETDLAYTIKMAIRPEGVPERIRSRSESPSPAAKGEEKP